MQSEMLRKRLSKKGISNESSIVHNDYIIHWDVERTWMEKCVCMYWGGEEASSVGSVVRPSGVVRQSTGEG